ncbi:MAG: cation transporter, partial [Acidaminococcaceae bacterium]|nr:cation transporter [Acidaminococcaceae bacterium]
VGVIISLFIIKSGIEMITETLDDILGLRADKETARQIKDLLKEEPEVQGAYDLILFNYGPDKDYGAVHLELPDTMTVDEVDKLTRRVERKVYDETGIALVGIGVYGYNTGDDEAAKIRDRVREMVMAHEWVLQFHGFHIDVDRKKMRFDAVMSFDINAKEGLETLYKEMQDAYPEYEVLIVPDVDVSD